VTVQGSIKGKKKKAANAAAAPPPPPAPAAAVWTVDKNVPKYTIYKTTDPRFSAYHITCWKKPEGGPIDPKAIHASYNTGNPRAHFGGVWNVEKQKYEVHRTLNLKGAYGDFLRTHNYGQESYGADAPVFDYGDEYDNYPESWDYPDSLINLWIPFMALNVVMCCCVGMALCFGGGLVCGWIANRYVGQGAVDTEMKTEFNQI